MSEKIEGLMKKVDQAQQSGSSIPTTSVLGVWHARTVITQFRTEER